MKTEVGALLSLIGSGRGDRLTLSPVCGRALARERRLVVGLLRCFLRCCVIGGASTGYRRLTLRPLFVPLRGICRSVG
jgi:hypothetical protein